jgi:four helix bundle protein
MSLRSYRDLVVWQRALELAEECYRLARNLPAIETFGLASQLRRASMSIVANIAEGYGREHRGDYIRHLSIAKGSLAELESLLMLGARVGYFGVDELLTAARLSDETSRMLQSLIKRLRGTAASRERARP